MEEHASSSPLGRRRFLWLLGAAFAATAVAKGLKPAAASRAQKILSTIDWNALDGCNQIAGFNYQPSWGSSGIVIWLDQFSAERFRFELSRGQELFPRFNCVRLWLSRSAYKQDPKRAVANFRTALDICNQLDLLVIPCLFTRWAGNPPFDPVRVEHFSEGDFEKQFRPFIEDIVSAGRGENNILAWDLCNEPREAPEFIQSPAGVAQYRWLRFVHETVKRTASTARTCVGTVSDQGWGERCEPYCDLITPHFYGYPTWEGKSTKKITALDFPAYMGEIVSAYLAELRRRGVRKPVLSTETCWGSLDDAKRGEIIAQTLTALREHRVGFLAHALFTSPVADLHPPQLGPVGRPGYMGFISMDGALRPHHGVFNDYCG